MKSFKDKITDYEKTNPASLFYEFGLSPNDIRDSIIDTFTKYFHNKNALQENAISNLVNNWFAYLTVYRDHPDSLKNIDSVLDIFNGAKQINPDETFKAYAYWFPELSQSISRFWSLYNSQRNIETLCIEDFLEESLRIIGQAIEGLSKPFLKLLIQLNRIRRKKPYDLAEIQSKDLGSIIDELLNTSDITELLIIEPNSIRLNQWRNIAYHHNSKVIADKIICWYKKDGTNKEFSISKDELIITLKKILLTFKIIRISETIFCIDNIIQIQGILTAENKPEINIREEAKLLDFYSLLSSQGFKATDLQISNEVAILKIKDLQEYEDFQKRAIHSTQFIYNLWLLTKAKRLIIEFYIFDGNQFLTAEIDSSNFLKSNSEEVGISKLLENIRYTFVTLNFAQNINPFKNLQLSDEIKKTKQIFASQLGEKISEEEFAKQFTLSIFSNYLALQSEGLNEIKINIGADGSITRTENQKRNILLHVPARIKSKAFQLKLIELLDTVIDLYEKRELRVEIVQETKEMNKYYFKKSLIREQLFNKSDN